MQKEINFLIIVLLSAAMILAISTGVSSAAPGYEKWVSIFTIGTSVVFGIRLRHVIEHDTVYESGMVTVMNALKAIGKALNVYNHAQ